MIAFFFLNSKGSKVASNFCKSLESHSWDLSMLALWTCFKWEKKEKLVKSSMSYIALAVQALEVKWAPCAYHTELLNPCPPSLRGRKKRDHSGSVTFSPNNAGQSFTLMMSFKGSITEEQTGTTYGRKVHSNCIANASKQHKLCEVETQLL